MARDDKSKTLLLVICGGALVGLCGLLFFFLKDGEQPTPHEDAVQEPSPAPPRPVGPTRLGTAPAERPAPAATRSRAPTHATPVRKAQPAPAAPPPPAPSAAAPTQATPDPAAPAVVQESHEDRIKRLARELAEAGRTKSLTREQYEYKAHELKELKEVVAREKRDRAIGLSVHR